MRKECELCREEAARMYCESDQASLCWECDAKVHAANFLVARHTRTLLCHHCHSPTPWSASGPNLGPTVSVCHLCVAARPPNPDLASCRPSLRPTGRRREDPRVREDAAGSDGDGKDVVVVEDDFDGEEEEEEEEGGEEEDDDDEEEENVDSEDEEEGDNQVVPWSASPPPAASSSTSEVSFPHSSDTFNHNNVRSPHPSKRMRDDDDGGWHIEVSRPLQPAGTGVGDVETTSSDVSQGHKRPLFVHRPSPSVDRSHGRDDIDHLVSVAASGALGDRRL